MEKVFKGISLGSIFGGTTGVLNMTVTVSATDWENGIVVVGLKHADLGFL